MRVPIPLPLLAFCLELTTVTRNRYLFSGSPFRDSEILTSWSSRSPSRSTRCTLLSRSLSCVLLDMVGGEWRVMREGMMKTSSGSGDASCRLIVRARMVLDECASARRGPW